jgi:RNA polymerase sigma factor (TIGR02999 family)
MTRSVPEITALLNQWAGGDQVAGEKVMPLVYDELRRIARRHLNRHRSPQTLQTTAVVHEAYMRLSGDSAGQWESRGHFFGVAAKAMRHVLVDYARTGAAAKRGGVARPVALDEVCIIAPERMPEVVALDGALTDLAKLHPRQCQVVELRFFGGLSVDETAGALKVSAETVMRDWRAAKAWLYREMERGHASSGRNDA